MKNIFEIIHKNSERGQAIILVAFAIVGLVAILGLMIDGGILLIEYARLKRGIDSASIASASQFRKGFNEEKLRLAGQEFLRFNQSDAVVFISICNPSGPALPDPLPKIQPDPPQLYHDPGLCFNPPRKLVRITANRHVNFGFMRIVGINGTDIEATSVGEAAAIDMVLVIDTSSSMAYDTSGTGANDPADPADPVNFPGDNPEVCNDLLPSTIPGRCEPLGDIIDVAVNFVQDQLLFYPYDQVALISTTQQTPGGNRNAFLALRFNNNYNEATGTATTEIQTAIRALKVFEPPNCDLPAALVSLGGCLRFEPTYLGVDCVRHPAAPNDQSACGSSNFGGALRMAGRQFDTARQEAFWVTIALIGGPATATDSVPGETNWILPSGNLESIGRDPFPLR